MIRRQNTAKIFLSRYRDLVRQRDSLKRSIDSIRASAMDTSVRLKAVRVQSSAKVNDPMAESAVEAVDLTAKLAETVREIDEALEEIVQAIRSLVDQKQRTLLTMKYIEGLSWTDVQEQMGYEKTQIYVYHGRALAEINKYLKVRTKTDY